MLRNAIIDQHMSNPSYPYSSQMYNLIVGSPLGVRETGGKLNLKLTNF